MKKMVITCDICKKENKTMEKDLKIDVIFLTEQTEGTSCKPYLSSEKLDLCMECYNKILQGNYIFAKGAQGYNEYYFK